MCLPHGGSACVRREGDEVSPVTRAGVCGEEGDLLMSEKPESLSPSLSRFLPTVTCCLRRMWEPRPGVGPRWSAPAWWVERCTLESRGWLWLMTPGLAVTVARTPAVSAAGTDLQGEDWFGSVGCVGPQHVRTNITLPPILHLHWRQGPIPTTIHSDQRSRREEDGWLTRTGCKMVSWIVGLWTTAGLEVRRRWPVVRDTVWGGCGERDAETL
ncbi:hypothetical protein NDU88_002313 [Pleurodeles waltl]|uniref:Uncharacterized protein n=1 Tax=Pleurodeles waltl TaxID=8319 RepID=A0AAV7TKF1_PLEWA|nr:hypothetical protein NDU88_002313 [Pleurodeles waltl]